MSTLRQLITSDKAQSQIAAALPEHVTVRRFTRAVLTAMNKTPKLEKCTQSSFLNAMMDCSTLGLEPDGRLAHLIPYGDQCTLVVDYKGYVKLAYQSGAVRNIETGVVYDGDAFDYETCKHTPWEWCSSDRRPEKRGDVKGAYCVVELKDGAVHRERMTKDEIESIRKRSKAGRSGPWVTDWNEMARKTVFRRATKWIPLSSQVAEVLHRDGDRLEETERKQTSSSDLIARIEGKAVEPPEQPETDAETEPPYQTWEDTIAAQTKAEGVYSVLEQIDDEVAEGPFRDSLVALANERIAELKG